MLTKQEIHKLFDDFSKLKALVIGDVMVDSYLYGKVERISPEAPVPVVSVKERVNHLGGAANVALNIASLGAQVVLCSVLGNDQKGDEFLELMEKRNLPAHGVIKSNNRITTTKFRIIGNKTQMLRVDEELTSPICREDSDALLQKIIDIANNEKVDVIVFEDYDKGVISKELIEKVVVFSEQKGIPVTADPKKDNFLCYNNVTLFKPNLKELKEGLKNDFNHKNTEELIAAILKLKSLLHNHFTMVTLSEDGVFITNDTQQKHIPAHVRNIADVSGAGDTVISVASLCLAMGADIETIASLSNLAGGLVCEEVGVVPVDKGKLLKEVDKLFES
jgi:rfaE bifunctional protein kinase chain/domain